MHTGCCGNSYLSFNVYNEDTGTCHCRQMREESLQFIENFIIILFLLGKMYFAKFYLKRIVQRIQI